MRADKKPGSRPNALFEIPILAFEYQLSARLKIFPFFVENNHVIIEGG
jgi:hypothetical protein